MPEEIDQVMGLITGRWRSQMLVTGIETGVFESVAEAQGPVTAQRVAKQENLDEQMTHRLMRGLSGIGLLTETGDDAFSLTEAGRLLTEDHPMSLRGIARLEEGPTHYAIWKHLPEIVREGHPNGFQREFGHGIFEHTQVDEAYAERFNEGMTSLSQMESAQVQALLEPVDLTAFDTICDVGGGHGHLLCTLLEEAPETQGLVLEQPPVANDQASHWHRKVGLEDRVSFEAGDFFETVPEAAAYLMKHILHDWPDEQCLEILATVRSAAPSEARLFICEMVVPGPDEPHMSKLMDVHMMVATTGRERTAEEYSDLLERSGWTMDTVHTTPGMPIGVIEARAD